MSGPQQYPVGTMVYTPTKRVAKVVGHINGGKWLRLEYIGVADDEDKSVSLRPALIELVLR